MWRIGGSCSNGVMNAATPTRRDRRRFRFDPAGFEGGALVLVIIAVPLLIVEGTRPAGAATLLIAAGMVLTAMASRRRKH